LFDDGQAERFFEAHRAKERSADRKRKFIGVAVDIGRRRRGERVEDCAAHRNFAPTSEVESVLRRTHISGAARDYQDQFEAVRNREIGEVVRGVEARREAVSILDDDDVALGFDLAQ
jgi:hypothetical protein